MIQTLAFIPCHTFVYRFILNPDMFDTLSLLKLDGLVDAQEKSTIFSMKDFLASKATELRVEHFDLPSRYVATKQNKEKPVFTIFNWTFDTTFNVYMTLLGSCSESLYTIRRRSDLFTVHCPLDDKVLYDVRKDGCPHRAIVLRCDGGMNSSWLRLQRHGCILRITEDDACVVHIREGVFSVRHAVVSKGYDSALFCLIVSAIRNIINAETERSLA